MHRPHAGRLLAGSDESGILRSMSTTPSHSDAGGSAEPNGSVLRTSIPGMTGRHGKVRDIYDFGDRLLLVATDRISAFDGVLPTGIPDKGRVLTQISRFWFEGLVPEIGLDHHLLSTDPSDLPLPDGTDTDALAGRSMVTKKCDVVPVECIVRGYLAGSGWKEYQKSQTVCGIDLPAGLDNASELPEPIFTPSTKAEQGEHDENISFEQSVDIVGRETAEQLRDLSLQLYKAGREHARQRGIIIADTKFEFGRDADGRLTLIDEVLTPDSSRFWPADQYQPGANPPSFDKQFVRDWLEEDGWDKKSAPPQLPDDIVATTRSKYVEAYETISGQKFGW